MDRLACVEVIALPLQLLWQRHPEWSGRPMAVVDRDEPDGTIEWVDRRARRARIEPGMRYAEGLSLCGELRAGTVEDEAIAAAVEAIAEELRDHSPFVQSAEADPGGFWVDATGLEDLYTSLEAWAEAIAEQLKARCDLYASIAVGFTRFGTRAVARVCRGIEVLESYEDERRRAREVPLGELGVAPDLRDELRKLGIETVGEFVELPPAGLKRRYGGEVVELHRRARGDLAIPLQADPADGAIELRFRPDGGARESTRLIFGIKRQLNPVLARLSDRSFKIESLELTFVDRRGETEGQTVRPSSPTDDGERLIELVRLHLENRTFEAAIDEVAIAVATVRSPEEQLDLFAESSSRDLEAAERAIERLRAEFGRRAVVRASLQDRHLPEARWEWEPFEGLGEPDPQLSEDERRRTTDRPRRWCGGSGNNPGRSTPRTGPTRWRRTATAGSCWRDRSSSPAAGGAGGPGGSTSSSSGRAASWCGCTTTGGGNGGSSRDGSADVSLSLRSRERRLLGD
ncbi:MAG: DNA polymerase Y family protein [Bradymonadaceae bacterium]